MIWAVALISLRRYSCAACLFIELVRSRISASTNGRNISHFSLAWQIVSISLILLQSHWNECLRRSFVWFFLFRWNGMDASHWSVTPVDLFQQQLIHLMNQICLHPTGVPFTSVYWLECPNETSFSGVPWNYAGMENHMDLSMYFKCVLKMANGIYGRVQHSQKWRSGRSLYDVWQLWCI